MSLLCCLILHQVSQVHNLVRLIAQMHLCIQNWDQKDTLAELIWIFFLNACMFCLKVSIPPRYLITLASADFLMVVTCAAQPVFGKDGCHSSSVAGGRLAGFPTSNQHFWRRHPVPGLIFLLIFTIVVRFCVTHSLLTSHHSANGQ